VERKGIGKKGDGEGREGLGNIELLSKSGEERTYRPHSRIMRELPNITAMRLPKELRAIRKLSPRTALPEPNTRVKKREAAISFASRS
jgi:hypothetical protein